MKYLPVNYESFRIFFQIFVFKHMGQRSVLPTRSQPASLQGSMKDVIQRDSSTADG
jgi:hypothetical protein